MSMNIDRTNPPPEPTPVKRCHHRWAFHCWAFGVDGEHDPSRYLVERCRRCAMARLTWYREGGAYPCSWYADSVPQAILGRPLDERELQKVAANVGVN